MEIRKVEIEETTAKDSHRKHAMLDEAIKAVNRARNLMEELMCQQRKNRT
jgi:hypothetical protein